MLPRRSTRPVMVGDVAVGGEAPVSVQSMTNTDTRDVEATLSQIRRLAAAGCEIIRGAIPRLDVLDAFAEIVDGSPLPVVADVHFDHRIAIGAAVRGAAKLRINPGNIGDMDRVDAIIDAAGVAGIPIRIGVNAGSLAEEYRDLDWELADKLAASAASFIKHFESRGFEDIVVSAKASSVNETVAAY
ncbi:MAG: flavodoxin-dependent (E)-4-hydroxy-3-methylbut-2-enyl-diphosphate synthase, partial [Coriobacteriales bacterium]|nr:flavodoxin-dependent (E)-4-hydroxy-3-methylbut-2-enyl-diphosphate synthase [Coriobacteriales bacterium]